MHATKQSSSPARPRFSDPTISTDLDHVLRAPVSLALQRLILRRPFMVSYVQSSGDAGQSASMARAAWAIDLMPCLLIAGLVCLSKPAKGLSKTSSPSSYRDVYLGYTRNLGTADVHRTKRVFQKDNLWHYGAWSKVHSRCARSGPIRGCCLCRKGWDLLSRELLPDWVGPPNS